MLFRGPNGLNSNNHIIPKHKDIIKHPFMKKHSCKPILNQIMIYIHFPSTNFFRILRHLGIDFVSYLYLTVLHHLGVDFAHKNYAV